MVLELAREFGKLIRFGSVGVIATGLHLVVAGFLLYRWPMLSPLFVNLVAFVIAFQFSYLGHRYFSFQREGNAWRFLIIASGGYLLNNVMLMTVLAATPLSSFTSIAIATLSVPLLVYLFARLWVFQ